GGGTFDVNGQAIWCARGIASIRPLLGNVRFNNWKRGPQFESGQEGPPEEVRIRGLTLGRPYIHPRDPAHLSEVGQGLRVTCRPSQGYAMVPWVDIDGLTIAESLPGSYSPRNAHTGDQVVLQGVVGGVIRNVVSRHGGEVGFSMSFGSRGLNL